MNKGTAITILIWFALTGGSLLVNLSNENNAHERLALETAQAFFQQIIYTRAWNARHGGVYVPVSPDTPPNPYLQHPDRDLVTTKGVALTMINPAYMTRQIAEIAASGSKGIQFHITSLKPIRPANKALDWEKPLLESFDRGVAYQGAFYSDGTYRYMAPLKVEASCLKCHGEAGYRVGDVRGGISVTLPHYPKHLPAVLVGAHVLIFLGGSFLIFIGMRLLGRKHSELELANSSLKTEIAARQKVINQLNEEAEKVRKLSGIVPICMYCKKIRDDQGYWNALEKFISENSAAQLSHSICPKCLEKKYPLREHGDDPEDRQTD